MRYLGELLCQLNLEELEFELLKDIAVVTEKLKAFKAHGSQILCLSHTPCLIDQSGDTAMSAQGKCPNASSTTV